MAGSKDKEARREAQVRLAETRKQQAAVQRRRNVIIAVVSVVVVGAIAAVVVLAISDQNAKSSSKGPTPAAATASNGGIPHSAGPTASAAAASGVPLVDIYEDYQCPICKQFELTDSATVNKLAAAGKARFVYHAINIIGPNYPGTLAFTSSLRAASAAACASDAGKFEAFHDIAFKNQPDEGTGISDAQLASWATQAGIDSPTFTSCLDAQKYVPYAKRVDAQASDRGVTGTPTLYINGKALAQWPQPSSLESQIAAATKKQ